MSIALYMDAHVHAAITEQLRRRGVDVLTAQDDDSDDLIGPKKVRSPEICTPADENFRTSCQHAGCIIVMPATTARAIG